MKVLQVNCVYKKGSTGKITYDLHRELIEAGIESIICYGRGEKIKEPGVHKVCPEWYSKLNNVLTRITGVMYGGCFFSTNRLISIIRREKPDVVHLQCINGYFVNIYRLVGWLKRNHIRTVLTLHAEFMYTANCGHALDCERWKIGCGKCPRRKEETKSVLFDRTHQSWEKMKKAFEGFEDDLIVTSVSPWLMERAKQSPIMMGKKHCVVYNGVDTTVFHLYDTYELRQKYGGSNRKIIFHVTPFFSTERNHFKGGWYICELAKRRPNVLFLVAGRYDEASSVPPNVILLGQIFEGRQLAEYYSMADVTVIASKRETFSMVVAESLCCGTPVVGFEAGGPEQIAIPQYSRFGPYGNLNLMEENIKKMLEMEPKEKIALLAQQRYSSRSTMKEYITIYSENICSKCLSE